MLAPTIAFIASQLLKGKMPNEQAGKLLTALAEGVQTLEANHEKVLKASRASVMNGIGLGAALQELADVLPRDTKLVDAEKS